MTVDKYTVDLEWEQVDSIIRKELTRSRKGLEYDLKRTESGDPVGVFSLDPKEDVKKLRKLIKALKTVESWYGVAGDLE